MSPTTLNSNKQILNLTCLNSVVLHVSCLQRAEIFPISRLKISSVVSITGLRQSSISSEAFLRVNVPNQRMQKNYGTQLLLKQGKFRSTNLKTNEPQPQRTNLSSHHCVYHFGQGSLTAMEVTVAKTVTVAVSFRAHELAPCRSLQSSGLNVYSSLLSFCGKILNRKTKIS